MASFKVEVKKAEEFTINELAIIKDEIEVLIRNKHPTATLNVVSRDLDSLIADQEKNGYTPSVQTEIKDDGAVTNTVEEPVIKPADDESTSSTNTDAATEESASTA